MKKILVILTFSLITSYSYAYYFGGIYIDTQGSRTINVNDRFDIYWGFNIYEDYVNDPHPAMSLTAHVYLSKDSKYDSNDVLLATLVESVSQRTGTLYTTAYNIKMPASGIVDGKCYLIIYLDPFNKIGDSKQNQNFAVREVFVVSNTTTGIKPIKPITYSIYPNPVTDILTVEQNAETLSVFNINGQLVYYSKETKDVTKINVSDWTPGIYTLILRGSSGEGTSEKFIVK